VKQVLLVVIVFGLSLAAALAQDEVPVSDYFYTYHRADGTRVIDGAGTFPNVAVFDTILDEVPLWLIGKSVDEGVQWMVATDTGRIGFVRVNGSQFATLSFSDLTLPPGAPPVEGPFPTTFSPDDVATLTHPIPLGEAVLYVAETADIVLWRAGNDVARLALNVPADARIAVNSDGQAALYVDGTNQRYAHGIMGDDIEGAAMVVLEADGDNLEIVSRVDLPGEEVFEGIMPMWADVDGDGVDDLITTASNSRDGAQIRVFRADGTHLAAGPAIGRGNRWRHQLAWGAFGPGGEMELVDVLTPHIGGVVEFFRDDGQTFNIVASLGGYTSHTIGSRNLDMAVAGDFNGDGQLEIVVADQSRQTINGLQHTTDGVEPVWSLPLAGRLTTNLAAVTLPDGRLGLAAGTEEGRIHVWLSG
jgi:hypothetical protein